MTTMNKQQFVREATTTILNDGAKSAIDSDDSKARKATEEWMSKLFDILDKDGYYIGRRGVKY